MTLAGLAAVLEGTGLPVTYRAWPVNEAPALPFLCYLVTGTDTLPADGRVYYQFDRVRVELYTAIKSPELEALVENALDGFHWEKSENYLDSERCYKIDYDIQV